VAALKDAAPGAMKNARGNNIGDARYTVSFDRIFFSRGNNSKDARRSVSRVTCFYTHTHTHN